MSRPCSGSTTIRKRLSNNRLKVMAIIECFCRGARLSSVYSCAGSRVAHSLNAIPTRSTSGRSVLLAEAPKSLIMITVAGVLLLITLLVAVATSYQARAALATYGDKANGLPYEEGVVLERREKRWRIAAHVAAFLALTPVLPVILSFATNAIESLLVTLGAAAVGTVALIGVKLIARIRIPLRNMFSADVTIANQVLLALSGLTVLGLAGFVYTAVAHFGLIVEIIKAGLKL
jgi:hypothetical protein